MRRAIQHHIILYTTLAALMTLMAACRDRIPTIEVETDKTAAVKENMINANRKGKDASRRIIRSFDKRIS